MIDLHAFDKLRVKSAEWATYGGDVTGTFGKTHGIFDVSISGETLRVIASVSDEWEHIGIQRTTGKYDSPTMKEISVIKDNFFGEDEIVCIILTGGADKVHADMNCAHLWRFTGGEMPLPPALIRGGEKG